jgi:hypothetical protein
VALVRDEPAGKVDPGRSITIVLRPTSDVAVTFAVTELTDEQIGRARQWIDRLLAEITN